jgi:hypothetical protein
MPLEGLPEADLGYEALGGTADCHRLYSYTVLRHLLIGQEMAQFSTLRESNFRCTPWSALGSHSEYQQACAVVCALQEIFQEPV